MYQISLTTSLHEATNKVEYRQLVDACTDSTVFNDWPWLLTCTEHLTRKQQFLGILVKDAQLQLVGFISLRVTKERLHSIPLRVARFVQYPLGDRIAILLHPNHLSAWEPLLAFLNESSGIYWDCMIWNEWTETQGLLHRAEQWAKQSQMPFFHRVTSQCPVLALTYATEKEMIDSYSSKMRTDLRRRKKKLKALRSEILHLRPSTDETPMLVEKMKATEAASWKGDEGVGIFNTPLSYAFFKDLSLRLAAFDQLDLSIVNIDEELASYKYGFYFRETFYDYSIGYLPQHSKLGLGRILLDELALSALRRGYQAVDASRVGATTQHLLLERTDKTIPHHRIYWFGSSLKSKLLKLLVMQGKPRMNIIRKKYRKWVESRKGIQRKAEG